MSRSTPRPTFKVPEPPKFRQAAALMTPSASPPYRRSSSSMLPTTSDEPSPSKRQKLLHVSQDLTLRRSKTPSSFSTSTPESEVATPLDLHAARFASSSRVLDVWSQLADKYNRPLEEDDIIDLESNSIIKAGGVLSAEDDKVWEIGCFSEAAGPQSECGSLRTDIDEDIDELDSIAEFDAPQGTDDALPDDLELKRQSKPIPPVQELDPDDAEDLREFLEAEKRRRELYGDVDSESDDSFGFGSTPYDMRTQSGGDDSQDLERASEEQEGNTSDHVDGRVFSPSDLDVQHGGPNEPSLLPLQVENESEDELAGWDSDQWNAVHEKFPVFTQDDIPAEAAGEENPTPPSVLLTPPSSVNTSPSSKGRGRSTDNSATTKQSRLPTSDLYKPISPSKKLGPKGLQVPKKQHSQREHSVDPSPANKAQSSRKMRSVNQIPLPLSSTSFSETTNKKSRISIPFIDLDHIDSPSPSPSKRQRKSHSKSVVRTVLSTKQVVNTLKRISSTASASEGSGSEYDDIIEAHPHDNFNSWTADSSPPIMSKRQGKMKKITPEMSPSRCKDGVLCSDSPIIASPPRRSKSITPSRFQQQSSKEHEKAATPSYRICTGLERYSDGDISMSSPREYSSDAPELSRTSSADRYSHHHAIERPYSNAVKHEPNFAEETPTRGTAPRPRQSAPDAPQMPYPFTYFPYLFPPTASSLAPMQPPLPTGSPALALPAPDGNIQYFLVPAQYMMNGFPSGSSGPMPSSSDTSSSFISHPSFAFWPPATPTRRHDGFFFTPGSRASAPPSSSPVRGLSPEIDPSPSNRSKPLRARSQSRLRSVSGGLELGRPRSALRSNGTPSRTRSLDRRRRVSFSEVLEIEGEMYRIAGTQTASESLSPRLRKRKSSDSGEGVVGMESSSSSSRRAEYGPLSIRIGDSPSPKSERPATGRTQTPGPARRSRDTQGEIVKDSESDVSEATPEASPRATKSLNGPGITRKRNQMPTK